MDAQPTADSVLASAKAALRREAKQHRQSHRQQHRQQADGLNDIALCSALELFLAGRFADSNGERVWTVSYSSLPGEPDLSGLLSYTAAEGSARPKFGPIALTRTPESGHALTIHPAESDLERHHYGFAQPVGGSPVIPDDQIGAVLVPGLAFDRAGGRLGFGAGYYDRLLARLLDVPGGANLAIVGVSDGFLVETVPMGRLDIPMTHLATSAGVMPVHAR